MLIQDVVIHTNDFCQPEQVLTQPPYQGRFQLADDLWVGRLDDQISDTVLDVCDPPGLWARKPPRLFGQFYAYVREPIPAEKMYEWDTDNRLLTCVALSRVVHPTSISFQYAAQIVYGSNGKVKEVVPGPVKGHGADASPPNEDQRDWLIRSDLEALRELFQHFSRADLPPRVWRALWYHEYAARTRYADVRCTLITTALEALVHTDRQRSTHQFIERVPGIAADVGVVNFSRDDAETAYDLRSRLSHGQGLAVFIQAERQIYERMELIVRAAIKRAILDKQFGLVFSSEDLIRAQWPLAP